MTLNERIKQSGITKKKLAERLDVSIVTISYWLNGTRSIPEDKRLEIKKILDKVEDALS